MKYVLLTLLVGCANDPQYVECGTSDTMDTCTLDSTNAVMMGTGQDTFSAVKGSLHVPVMPLDADLMKAQADLQKTMPDGVEVPMYRLDQYDVSVEYILKNLDDTPATVKIQLNVANELFSWDPSLIMPAGDESPPAPGLQGDIPIDVQEHGEIDSLFREDQLLEAAIDLDQISRGNINMYAATLTVNKNDESFQPLSAVMPPPMGSQDPPAQVAMGSAVPRAAFRNVVRVDLVLKPDDHHTQLQFNIRVRPHVDKVIHDMGMNAPVAELTILDPAAFVPAYTP
ncbi:MAG: hypothetical protein QM831_45625 [Kofleriaceae bacterium]